MTEPFPRERVKAEEHTKPIQVRIDIGSSQKTKRGWSYGSQDERDLIR